MSTTTTTKRAAMLARIDRHGLALLRLFPASPHQDPQKLCRVLLRLERKAHKLALDYCNGENSVTTNNVESLSAPIIAKVRAALGLTKNAEDYGLFLNYDARGYALKLDNTAFRAHQRIQQLRPDGIPLHIDMGGYGIIAPDLTNS